ncbi:hypothetical protein BDB01DRAFT_770074 [Pilobolus umbonatus]|nr:hypothetical protein BDB01DRAFT_770074 [Pilobolus umbonatus]
MKYTLLVAVTVLLLLYQLQLYTLNIHNIRHYRDTTEICNYTQLEHLLTDHLTTTNDTPHSMPVKEFTYDLETLIQRDGSFNLTIFIRYHSIQSIDRQLDTLLPNTVYVVCREEEAVEVNTLLSNKYDTVKLVTGTDEHWINRIKSSPVIHELTDYIILIDNPWLSVGHDYIQLILRLMNMDIFRSSLLGTEVVYPVSQAHYVNELKDIYVLKRDWFHYTLSMDTETTSISHLLEKGLGISSIGLPPYISQQIEFIGNINRQQQSILFYIDNNQSLVDLICQFRQHHPHVYVMSHDDIHVACSVVHMKIDRSRYQIHQSVRSISPDIVISTALIDNTNTDSTFIRLNSQHIRSLHWMSTLPWTALRNWNKPSVKIIAMVGGTRFTQMKRLLQSMKDAYYMGDRVDISILMDSKTNKAIHNYVNNYKWNTGHKLIKHRIAGVQLMQHYVESWYPSNEDEYGLILDDRMELSPAYYMWVKYTLLMSRYSDTEVAKRLIGISLYSPTVLDTDPSGRILFTPSKTVRTDYYRMQSTSLGALYFPEYWKEYHDYITSRLTDQSIVKKGHRHLMSKSVFDRIRSDKWVNSWRKYMDELIYMRGYVMLYSMKDNYSTVHMNINKKWREKGMSDIIDQLYNISLKMRHTIKKLPPIDTLPIFDIWGQLVDSQQELINKGHQIQKTFSACEPVLEPNDDPSDLLCPFAILQIVPKVDKHKEHTMTVDMYI